MNWGMISYEIPLERYPDTYNGQPLGVLALAAQARHYSLYLNAAYTSPELMERLGAAYAAASIKFDMGKSCLRFRNLAGIDLDAIGDIVASVTPERYIEQYEASSARLTLSLSAVTAGLVCGHHHLYSALARGMPPPPATPHDFAQILEQIWWRLDTALDLDMLRASARLGAWRRCSPGRRRSSTTTRARRPSRAASTSSPTPAPRSACASSAPTA